MSNETNTDRPARLSVLVPAGTYVLGDPCYSVPDDRWMEWLEAADYTNEDPAHILAAELDGHLVVGVGTEHGDGSYEDNHGNLHPVDAGLIGIVPIEIAGKGSLGERRVVIEITEETEIRPRTGDGVIEIGDYEIDTDPLECDWCGVDIKATGGWDGNLCRDCSEEQERQAAACPDCSADYGQEYDGEVCASCGHGAEDDDDFDYEDDDDDA